MEHLRFSERPQLHNPYWIGAFTGWIDAQDAATEAVRYLVKHLPAKQFAEIDPEEFYDFTAVRPVIYHNEKRERVLRWPANNFYYWVAPDSSRELVLFLGTEPSLKWRMYTGLLLAAIAPYQMQAVITMGSVMDTLPHTREATLTGSANRADLGLALEGLQINASRYQGPVGISSVFMDACNTAGTRYLSLMAHAPHYVQRAPNHKVTKALVEKLNQLLGLRVPLDELGAKSREFEEEVTKAIAKSVEVSAYVKKLERLYDEAHATNEEPLPSPEAMVQELEEFLKKGGNGGGPSAN